MNRGGIRSTWWFRALLYGVPFGVAAALLAVHRGHPPGVENWLVNGVFSGVLFGLWMGWVTRRQQVARDQRTGAFTAGLAAEDRTLAVRASRRGRVPGDPAIRVAAAALTRDQLQQSISHRSRNLAIFGAIGLLGLVMALTTTPWYWLAVLMFAALFVAQLQQPRSLRRRLARLHHPM